MKTYAALGEKSAMSALFQIALAGRSTVSIRVWNLSIKSLGAVRVNQR